MKQLYPWTLSDHSWNSMSRNEITDVEPTFEEVDMSIAYVFGAAVAVIIVGIIVVSRFKF